MKILHVVPTYLPAVRYGGPIYSVHALCRSLAAAGHDVQVFTTSVDGPGDSDVSHDAPVLCDGVQIHYSRSKWLRRLYYSTDLSARLGGSVHEFDVVHLHSVFLFPTLAGARASIRAGVPYVLSPRGMLVNDLIQRRSASVKRAWIRLFERDNLSKAATIHLTSGEEGRGLMKLGLALAPTVVIPNGVDLPSRFAANAVSADIRAITSEGFDILCFGRISWKKGLDRLIDATARLPTARVVIAGNDEDGLAPQLLSLTQKHGIGDRVRILARHIYDADKEALFSAARVFVLPSLSENFGNVVAEAMIRRLPVIVTMQVGAAELVHESGGGLVADGQEDDLVRALTAVLESDERRAAMGAAGERYARAQLTWAGIAHRFEQLYGELTSKARRRAAAV